MNNNGTRLSERDSSSNREQVSGEITLQITDADEDTARVPSSSELQSVNQHDTGVRSHLQFGQQNHHHPHHHNRWHHQSQAVGFPPLPLSSSNKINSQARGSGNLSTVHTQQVFTFLKDKLQFVFQLLYVYTN